MLIFVAISLIEAVIFSELFQIDVQKGQAPALCNSLGDPFVSEPVVAESETFMTVLHPNAIICSSTTSSDVVILRKGPGENWELELGDDDRKAGLPPDHYSIGHVFYFNSTNLVVVSDNEKYNPMPIYLIASQLGVIRSYSVINSQEKGEGAKFGTEVTPLDLSSFASSQPPQAVPQLPISQAQALTLPTSTASIAPMQRVQPQQPQPTTFSFGLGSIGSASAPFGSPVQKVAAQIVPQLPVKTAPPVLQPQQITPTPMKPKEEPGKISEEVKRNLNSEMEKVVKVSGDQLSPSPALLYQIQEFQKRSFLRY